MRTSHPTSTPCPCHSGLSYQQCCASWHAGTPTPTAVALMRSRYSAYAMKLESYLLATWHPAHRPPTLGFEEDETTQWIGLDIKQASEETDKATVEFVARYKINGRAYRLHEISRFYREHGRWLYVDGDVLES